VSEKNSDGKPENPAPKKQRRKNVGGKKPATNTITLRGKEIPPLQRNGAPSSYDSKRLEAMYVYVTDLDGCTLPELHQDPRFSDISYNTLKHWHHFDGWGKLRSQALSRIRARIQKQLEISMTETLRQELGLLDAMISESQLQLSRTAPKSWEGVAKLMLSALERKDAIVQRIAAEQLPPDEAGSEPGALPAAIKDGHFDANDFREAAKFLLEKRIERVKSADDVEELAGGDTKATEGVE